MLPRLAIRVHALSPRPRTSAASCISTPAATARPKRPSHLAGILKAPLVYGLGGSLRLHAFPGSISNLYAVEYCETGRVLLLDAGCASDFARVQAYLFSRGLSSANVAMVISSHAHPDHAGAAHKWKEIGVRVVAPRGINEWYAGPFGFMQWRIETGLVRYLETLHIGPFLAAFPAIVNQYWPSKKVWFPRHLDWDREIPIPGPLAPREELDVPVMLDEAFADWVAVPVPGHTDHMVALYHAATRTLYAADSLVNVRPKHGLQYSIQQDFLPLQVDSLVRLSRLEVRHLLMAHGGACTVGALGEMPPLPDELDEGLDEGLEEGLDAGGGEGGGAVGGKGRQARQVAVRRPHLSIDFRGTLLKLAASLHGLRRVPSLKGWRGFAHEFIYLPTTFAPRNRRIAKALRRRAEAEEAAAAK